MGSYELTSAAAHCSADIADIAADAGVNLRDCYQCGKCAAGCTVRAASDMNCREVLRNLQLGLLDRVLRSDMPWLCLHCGTCLARCPQNVDLPALNRALRAEAQRRGIVPVREVQVFDQAFIGNVERKGVSDEAMLAASFNLKTGHLLQDVGNAPKMMSLGLLSGKAQKPVNPGEVSAIFNRARELERQDRAERTCEGGERR